MYKRGYTKYYDLKIPRRHFQQLTLRKGLMLNMMKDLNFLNAPIALQL